MEVVKQVAFFIFDNIFIKQEELEEYLYTIAL
jgi:hypothetical protein